MVNIDNTYPIYACPRVLLRKETVPNHIPTGCVVKKIRPEFLEQGGFIRKSSRKGDGDG
jgi:hypothetical protein